MTLPDPRHPKIRTDAEGNLWLNFGEYGQQVEVAAFSADGSRLLTVHEVGIARVWEVTTGDLAGEIRPCSPLEGSGAAPSSRPFQVFVEAAALSPEGDLALLGLNDGTAGVFSVADGSRLAVLHDPDQPPAQKWGLVRTVRFSADGTRALAGFQNGGVGMWSRTGEQLLEFLRPSGAASSSLRKGPRPALVSSVDLSDDRRYLFVGRADLTARIWDLSTRAVVFSAHEHEEETIRLHLEGERVLWATDEGSVWSARPGETPVRCLATTEAWQEAVFSPDGTHLLARTETEVRRWSLGGQGETLTRIEPPGEWNDGATLLGFDRSGAGCFYPASPTTLVLDTGSAPVPLRCQAVESSLPKWLTAATGREPEPRGFEEVCLSPAGDLLVTRPDAPRVELWEVPSGQRRGVLEHPEKTHTLAFSRDGSLLAVSTIHHIDEGRSFEIHVWSVRDQRLIARLPGHHHFVYQMEFSPGNECLASVGHDRMVRLWDLKGDNGEPQEFARAEREDLDFRQVRVLSDGRLLIFRKTILEVHRGEDVPILEIPVPDYWSRQWAVSADEKTIACSGPSQTAFVWSLADGTLLQSYQAPIVRPGSLPGPLGEEIQATAAALVWQGPGGPYLHQGDGPRGWVTPLALSRDRRETVIPGRSDATLVSVGEPPRDLARLPFEGRLRASLVLEDRVLLANSAGQLFLHLRTAAEPSRDR